MNSFQQYMLEKQQRIAGLLKEKLETLPNSTLKKAMLYSTLNGGKRLRPIVVYAVGEALGTPLDWLDPPACAIELMHCFSLVHDDLPAMDNDDLRRGIPTCHKAFSEASAILTGDSLLTFSIETLAATSILSSSQRLKMIKVLTSACGSSGMALGQMLDIELLNNNPNIHQLNTIHSLKTGALLEACIKLGFIASNSEDEATLAHLIRFSQYIGLAFQIHDDILETEESIETLGKSPDSDEKNNKTTYPKLIGLDTAKKEVEKLYRLAIDSLHKTNLKSNQLESLADFIVKRRH